MKALSSGSIAGFIFTSFVAAAISSLFRNRVIPEPQKQSFPHHVVSCVCEAVGNGVFRTARKDGQRCSIPKVPTNQHTPWFYLRLEAYSFFWLSERA
jgi:hypothetical protein